MKIFPLVKCKNLFFMDNIIKISNGQIAYQNGLVLNDININITSGEFVYLIGRTGSGKTSLLRMLYGDLPLQAGEGSVCGFDLKRLKAKQIPFLRRKLGIVFQDFHLLTDRNVEKNLLFVMQATGWKNPALMKKRLEEVLALVGLGDVGSKMPHSLSGGEQQRVVMARALINTPEVILADEPTGNLDPDISDDLVGLLHKIKDNGATVIMATHDYRLIEKFPSRVIKIENGQLHELGQQ